MSVYSLQEIAKILKKDARTLRRWCIAGHIPSARMTQGGHWRISADSKQLAIKAVRASRPDYSRNKKRKVRPPIIGIDGTPVPVKYVREAEKINQRLNKKWPKFMA